MTTAIAERLLDAKTVETVLLHGDLSKLTPAERVSYYNRVCESLGLNPLTKPFDYLKLSGREVLYAKRDATEQLRKIHGVSIIELTSQHVGDVFVVTAKAQDRSGRTDASTGAVPLGTLKGEALANALMKAETKAKRRVTLSICGLGMLDESELDTMPAAPVVVGPVAALPDGAKVDTATGEEVTPAQSFPASDDGALRVVQVESQPTRRQGLTKFVVTFSDGTSASTIKERLGAFCEQLVQEQCAVECETKETRWGLDLEDIWRVRDDEGGADEPPPPTDDDLAF